VPEPLGKASDLSEEFVLRLDAALHRRLAAKALAAGESLNSFRVKTLCQG
jgi:predicted HicB family RNase H-like nuclease